MSLGSQLKNGLFIVTTLILSLIIAIYTSNEVFATSETINFQGKIVRNDTGNEGLNVVAGSPACVVAGNSNDTCDFRVKFYNATSAGTLLGTEVFNNIEIGYYDGVFNLVLGSGTYTSGSETSFRNIFLNNSQVFIEVDFAPDGSSYTETFLDSAGLRMGVRASAYAISSSGANKQFQFDINNDATGYTGVGEGQVFFDGDDNVLRVYDGSNWLAVQAYQGNYSSLWTVNETPNPDIISSYTGLDVAFGGDTSTAPFFYDVSEELLTLTNSTAGVSFRVNDSNSDTSPFVIDASGNVGIGTDTPGYKLEVTGGRTVLRANSEEYTLGISRTDGSAGNYWLGIDNTATPSLYFKNNAGNNRLIVADSGLITQISADSSENGIILKRPTTDSTHVQWQLFGQTNNKDFWITAFDGTSTKNFAKFYWDTSTTNFDAGDVGVGVATPDAFLDIKAATTSSAQINLTSSAGVDPSTPVSGDLWWNGTNLYFFDGSSNVDILVGTGGPGGGLFTDGGAVTYLTSTTDDFALGGTDNTAPLFFDEGAELLTLTNTTAGLSFRVNDEASDTTPFVIDADGNVGIGTSTPGAKLDIAGATSTISNTAGDITIDAYSGNVSFAGDSMTNVLNATFSGDVTLNGGQIRVGNHAANPTSIGEGAMVYNSTDKKLYYYKDTGWSEVGKVYSGTTGQTLRHNGTDWVANSALLNDGTNVTLSGQLKLGNYSSNPSTAGTGSVYFDTTLGSMMVYDGVAWRAISTSQLYATTGVVNNGSYLELVHNANTFDLISSAWVKVGSNWQNAKAVSNDLMHTLSTHWEEAESGGVIRVDNKLTNLELRPGIDVGTGADGSITVSANNNINTQNLISGRSCTDGGDAVNYSVTALTSTSATLSSTPATGCLDIGDEVLIMTMQNVYTNMATIGTYETLRVSSVSGTTVNFATAKTKYYGGSATSDANIGTGSTNHKVMLQRVPNYNNVTVSSTFNFFPMAWNGLKGGVMFFRANGTVTVSGTLHAAGTGFRGGTTKGAYGGGDNNGRTGGQGGEAFCGVGGAPGVYSGNGGAGAAGGGAGQSGNGGLGYCGGGGGGVAGGAGSASAGGAGGGGQGYTGAGGGAGYGTSGAGGATHGSESGGSYTSGDGGSSGAGIANGGGGGGGTYGYADLSKAILGSGGGKGTDYEAAGDALGDGGNGGGIVGVFATTISVSGLISSQGVAGENNNAGSYGGGGGGGSGGSVILAAQTMSLGTSLVTVAGGGGGVGVSSFNGGAGGAGRIALYYSNSITGSTANPSVTNSYTVNYFNYGIYTSPVISTPNAISYSNIRWHEELNTHGKISVQTRSGNSTNSKDGSWEAWMPSTATTNYLTLDDANTHTDWTGTNVTVAEGDVTRDIDFFEDEDEATASNITKLTSSTNGGTAERTIASTDLSTYTYITFWIRASQVGSSVKFGFGETAATENEFTFSIDTTGVWQKVYYDISAITGTSRNAVTKLRFTNLTASSNTIYIDNVKAEILSSDAGSNEIASTPNNYFQYRIIFTTRNTAYRPVLENIAFTWDTGFKIETVDANTLRLYNNSGKQQEIKLTATTASGSTGGGSNWTSSGGNIYRGSGNVGIGDTTPDTTLKVVGSLCVKSDANNCAGSTAGTIYANNLSIQSADLAEMYKIKDQSINQGDVVSFSGDSDSEIEKALFGNSKNVMGVISTAPGLVMNDAEKDSHRPVALLGRVPVKVIAGSRSIVEGDALGVSPIGGYAGVVDKPGYIVARALENTLTWSDSNCPVVGSVNEIIWPKDKGKNEEKPCFRVAIDTFEKETRDILMQEYTLSIEDYLYVGKVNAYVSVQWYQPEWVNEGIADLIGGDNGMWAIDGDRLVTNRDVSANSFTGTKGIFSILSGGLLNIADGRFTVDGSGNLGVAGDMLINGEIKGLDGNIKFSLGDSEGAKAFEIRNSSGQIVFSVDSKGEVGGSSVYKTTWLKVEASSNINVGHNFGKVPSDISIVVSNNSDGSNFSTKGLGSDYYYESIDNDNLKIVNTTNQDIFVKLTIQR